MAKRSKNVNLFEYIEELENEKGIPHEAIVEALKDSFKIAYTKKLEEEYNVFKLKGNNKNASKVKLSDALVRTELDAKTGKIELYHQFKVVVDDAVEDDFVEIELSEAKRKNPDLNVGDFYEEPISLATFDKGDVNRFISNFKQKISKLEKDALLETFKGRVGEIITGTVEKADSSCVIVNLGRTSATLFPKDLIGKETFKPGDPIKVYLSGIGKDNKNSSLIKITRSNADFLRKLFESEIHEIYDQTVIIKDIARIAGAKSKVSVYSEDPNVDASGACIGPNGNRIQSIVRQLGNSKDSVELIDVISYKPNLGLYLEECLKPGIVIGANIDAEHKKATVVTQNGTSRFAIGQKGYNVILTKKLTKLDEIEIIDESEALERGLEYKTIDEYTIEAREEMKRKVREEALARAQEVEKSTVVKEEKPEVEEELFIKDEIEEDELEEEIAENSPEVEEIEEEVVEEEKPVEVKPVKKEVKTTEPIVTTEVKTTTTIESLEKALEEEKEKETKKSSFKSKKKKEEDKSENVSSASKSEGKKMSIYTEEELADLDDELDEEYDDEDYSEYDSDEYYNE